MHQSAEIDNSSSQGTSSRLSPDRRGVTITRMFRILLVLNLVGALNACPFVCMGHAAGSDRSDAATETCPCCASSHAPDSDEPMVPAEEDGCCDCICNGAVVSDETTVSLDVWESVSFLDLLLLHNRVSAELTESAVAPDVTRGKQPPGRFQRSTLRALRI